MFKIMGLHGQYLNIV